MGFQNWKEEQMTEQRMLQIHNYLCRTTTARQIELKQPGDQQWMVRH
jgi:hypothetical protein